MSGRTSWGTQRTHEKEVNQRDGLCCAMGPVSVPEIRTEPPHSDAWLAHHPKEGHGGARKIREQGQSDSFRGAETPKEGRVLQDEERF